MQNDASQQSQLIIDLKKEEEILRQIKLIVENSHDAITGETLEGIVTSWNGGATRMFGYSAEEMIGQPISILIPDELKGELSILLDRVKSGEFVADHDSVRLRKDGSRINVALSISPIKLKDGTITGVSIVDRDITERKKKEESLRQAQMILENSHDAIIGQTLDGIVTSWNGGATKMFGYTSEEMGGRSMTSLFSPEKKDELSQLLEKVKNGEIVADYDTIWLRKDSTKVGVELQIFADVEFSIAPIHTDEGAIVGASLVGRDISIRKNSEQKVKELNEVRNKFINIISHQLRTPLSIINWNLETVLNGDFGKLDDSIHKFLQSTYKESLRVTSRIHDLIAAMDIEEERVTLQIEEVSIDSVVAGIMVEMTKISELKSISCQYIAPEKDLPAMRVDAEKIRTIISKLVENSIIYSKDNGKVVVKLFAHENTIRFEVADYGIGIPEQEQHHIFNRFFRASNAAVMQPDAFGLGLFIAKSFVEQHGGVIGFDSKEGKGSIFWFEIPLNR